MKILGFLIFLSSISIAQTAAVPALPITIPAKTIPAVTIPATTLTINTPRNGGPVTFTVPAQALPAQILPAITVTTTPVAAPVSLGTITLKFSCTAPPLPNGQPDLTNLTCTAVQQ